jgi:tRNA G37 N-methylase Trm5
VVDVGCAEGYYAVGFGMKIKEAKVFAFDTNEKALELCREMGKLNKVNVQTGGFCDSEKLMNLDLGERALIFCDCEGYEIELIDTQVASKLKEHDFLIETHDFIDISITKKLLEVLEQTHDCEIFESVDDILKAYEYQYSELEGLSLEKRLYVLSEGRPTIMRWIFARSRY